MPRFGVVAVCGAALVCSTSAAAQEQRWHAGFSLGASNARMNDQVVAVPGATGSTLSSDKRDPGYKLTIGYRFSPRFHVEGGYAHLGEFRATRDVSAPGIGSLNADIRVNGLVLDAVGVLPVRTPLSVYGRLGALFSETRNFRATSGALPGGTTGGSTIHDEINLKLGLGLHLDISRNVALRGEWERYFKVGNPATTGELDVDLYSLGVLFTF